MIENGLQSPLDALKDWLTERGVDEEQTLLLRQVVNTVFYASLGKEEGEPTHVRIAFPEHGIDGLGSVRDYVHVAGGYFRHGAWELMPLEDHEIIMAFSVESLVKIAPATNLSRSAVVVGLRDGRLKIQCLARRIKSDDVTADREEQVLLICSSAPGYIAIYYRGEELFRYEDGKRIDLSRRFKLHDVLFEKQSAVRRVLAQVSANVLELLPAPMFGGEKVSLVAEVVQHLVEKMISSRHGGIIAMLPRDCAPPIDASEGKYRFPQGVRNILASRLKESLEARAALDRIAWTREADRPDQNDIAIMQEEERVSSDALRTLIDSIGQLTVIDNALLFGPDLQLICTGYPIPTWNSREQQLVVREASTLSGEFACEYDIGQHGSRHRAAAAFARRHRQGLVFVASEDGPLRCLSMPEETGDEVLLWRIQLPDD